MDAVELSFPVNVTVDKLMESDDLDRIGEIEARSSAGKEASASHMGSGSGPCRIESSRNKKVDEDSCLHDNLPSRPQCGENSKGHDIEKVDGHTPLSPNQEGKLLGRKYTKRPVGIPSKRPKIDDAESCMKESGTGGHHSISSKAALDPIRCTLADKSQIVKLKRVHDGRKADKKFFRASVKSKYESLTSKAILACSDTFSGGNNILGTHGSKSDLHDIAKNLDELSLSELLDGSYKFPKLPMDKGKKYSYSNDSILLSVRKACSILCPPPHGIAEIASNVKASQSSQDPSFSTGSSSDCETKDKQLEELITNGKDQHSLQANWNESTVLHPKNTLEQLGLPAVHELESFLFFNPGSTLVPVQLTPKARRCNYVGMPPFPWSFSHGGNSKTSVDFCKVNSTKNSCQCKWVRIGSSSSSTYEHNVDSLSQQKIDDILQLMRSFTSILQPPFDGQSSKSIVMGTFPVVEVPEIMNSVHESVVPGSFKSKACQPHEVTHSLNGTYLDSNSKDNGSGVVSRCEISLDNSKFNLPLKDKAVPVESRTIIIDGCSVSGVNTGTNCNSWQSPDWEKYREASESDFVFPTEEELAMLKKATRGLASKSRATPWDGGPSRRRPAKKAPSERMARAVSSSEASSPSEDPLTVESGEGSAGPSIGEEDVPSNYQASFWEPELSTLEEGMTFYDYALEQHLEKSGEQDVLASGVSGILGVAQVMAHVGVRLGTQAREIKRLKAKVKSLKKKKKTSTRRLKKEFTDYKEGEAARIEKEINDHVNSEEFTREIGSIMTEEVDAALQILKDRGTLEAEFHDFKNMYLALADKEKEKSLAESVGEQDVE